MFNAVTVHLFSATAVIKKTQCFPVPLSSPAKPAERFRYPRVAHLEAGRKLVEVDSENLTNLIFRNVHVVPGKEPFNLLLRNVAVLVAFAIIPY